MRNLVLIHLESLNMMNYRMNSSLFPTLCELERDSLFFNRYYSTATSTIMVTTDLAYGGVLHDESCEGINWALNKQVYESSFVDRLHDEGYRTLVIQYPKDKGEDTQWTNINHRFGIKTDVVEAGQYSNYISTIESFVNESGEFFLWVCPYTANISYNDIELPGEYKSGIERWKKSYERLDDQVRDVIDVLKQSSHYTDTTIILYGDHGDDLYQHGWYGGLSHAVEPFETLIHTPLMIVDDRITKGVDDRLTDTTMLAGIAEGLLHFQKKTLSIDDILYSRPEYVMARNLYGAQQIKPGSFEKAYSVTDGKNLFIVSNRGMRFYNVMMDPACGFNILDLFVFWENEFVPNNSISEKLRFHFPFLYDADTLETIKTKMTEMRRLLIQYVKDLYLSGNCLERIYEMDFMSIYSENTKNYSDYDGIHPLFKQFGGVFEKYYKNKRIILYGAGGYGKYCYDLMNDSCEIIAWVDKDYKQIKTIGNRLIESPDVLAHKNYDIVFIAIRNMIVKQEVHKTLIEMGISKEMII